MYTVAIEPTIIYLPTEHNIDRPESEMTCHYLNSRAPGSLRLLTILTRVRQLQIIAWTDSPSHHKACNRSSGWRIRWHEKNASFNKEVPH